MSEWFTSSGAPGNRAPRLSAPLRAQFAAIEAALAKLPAFSGNASKILAFNSGGTAVEALSALTDGQLPATLTAKVIAGANYSSYSSSDTDITGLVAGSNAGALIEGKSGDHLVVGIRSAAATDGFHIVHKGAAADPDADAYAALLLSVTGSGITSPLTASFGGLSVGGAALVAESRQISAGSGLSGGGTLAADRTLSLDTSSARNADHSAISITAGTGLTGGGTIASTRSIALDTTSDYNVAHSGVSITAGTGLTGGGTIAATRSIALDTTNTRNVDHASVSISAGTGLSGGGTIAANRSIALDTSNTRNVDHAAVTFTAGNGLSGGGTLAADRTFALNVGGLGVFTAAQLAYNDYLLLFDISGTTHYRWPVYDVCSRIIAASTATLALTDINGTIVNQSASNYTLTIPPNSSVAVGVGCGLDLLCTGTGTITLAEGSGVTLISTGSAKTVSASGGGASLRKIATNTWVLVGAIE